MKVPNVSFGSLMVFQLNDGKPHTPIPTLLTTSFKYNNALKQYNLQEQQYNEEIDGTVHNALKNFGQLLQKQYAKIFSNNSKDVVLTEVDVYMKNPRETQKKYFINAATEKDEIKILKALSQSKMFKIGRFGR